VESTPLTRDGGVDLIACRNDDIGVDITLYIQCKNHASPVGVDVIRALNGVLPKGAASTRGVVVCPSGFTADAIDFARDRSITLGIVIIFSNFFNNDDILNFEKS